MRLSCALVPTPALAERARLAERLGYHSVWFPDSPALYGDVWIALAQAAQATERVGLGAGVIIPSLRHPAATAAAIAHIEALAPGRLRVALGTGFTGRRCFGKRALSWKSMERYLAQLRGLLRGELVEIDGAAARLMHPEGVTAPLPLATPLFVAANGPKGLSVAAKHGDGLVCAGVVPEGGKDAALLVMGTAFMPGESFETPRVFEAIGPGMAVVLHGTYEALGEGVDNLPGGAGWRKEIEAFPEAQRHLYVHEGHLVEMTERDRRHVSPAAAAGTTFSGTPGELRARVSAMEASGTVAELVYWPMGDIPGELERMAEALQLKGGEVRAA